jgi:hypothetical protein
VTQKKGINFSSKSVEVLFCYNFKIVVVIQKKYINFSSKPVEVFCYNFKIVVVTRKIDVNFPLFYFCSIKELHLYSHSCELDLMWHNSRVPLCICDTAHSMICSMHFISMNTSLSCDLRSSGNICTDIGTVSCVP